MNTNYNVRIVRTPSGKLRLGFVHYLSKPTREKCGPFRGCKGQTWKDAPAKIRKELAEAMGAKLLPMKK